jgi:hypothetical protein
MILTGIIFLARGREAVLRREKKPAYQARKTCKAAWQLGIVQSWRGRETFGRTSTVTIDDAQKYFLRVQNFANKFAIRMLVNTR